MGSLFYRPSKPELAHNFDFLREKGVQQAFFTCQNSWHLRGPLPHRRGDSQPGTPSFAVGEAHLRRRHQGEQGHPEGLGARRPLRVRHGDGRVLGAAQPAAERVDRMFLRDGTGIRLRVGKGGGVCGQHHERGCQVGSGGRVSLLGWNPLFNDEME